MISIRLPKIKHKAHSTWPQTSKFGKRCSSDMRQNANIGMASAHIGELTGNECGHRQIQHLFGTWPHSSYIVQIRVESITYYFSYLNLQLAKFKISNWTHCFESHFVWNPKERPFCRVEDQLFTGSFAYSSFIGQSPHAVLARISFSIIERCETIVYSYNTEWP